MKENLFYVGDGRQRTANAGTLPEIDIDRMKSAEGYRAGEGLVAAVNAALRLGMPLLLTGEPGTGKSRLAYSLAWELMGQVEPLRFIVKSDTKGTDLLYEFDTVGRFHAAHGGGDVDARRFLKFNALGKAILYTYDQKALETRLGPAAQNLQCPPEPRRSVVLIDEIDKAPRDVPNDLLWELEELCFSIPEIATTTGNKIAVDSTHDVQVDTNVFSINKDARNLRPIIIITSNSEKSLPDAFLRRCLYYNVPFPAFDESKAVPGTTTVHTIVASRLGSRFTDVAPGLGRDAIAFFRFLREARLERKPGLAELLNWLDFLLPPEGVNARADRQLKTLPKTELLHGVQAILLKNAVDQEQADNLFVQWEKQLNPRA